MSGRIVPLAAAAREDCGDKAANLARLVGLGCRVPNGVVLPKIWLEEHLSRCGLDEALLALERAGEITWRAAASAIRESIMTGPLDPRCAPRLPKSSCGGAATASRSAARRSARTRANSPLRVSSTPRSGS